MRYPTFQQLPWRPAHGHTCDVASPTKKPIVKVAVDVKEAKRRKRLLKVIWWLLEVGFKQPENQLSTRSKSNHAQLVFWLYIWCTLCPAGFLVV